MTLPGKSPTCRSAALKKSQVTKQLIESLFAERMDQNEGSFIRYMNDLPFQKLVNNWISSQAYKKLRVSAAAAGSGR
jgi:type I restriction enzyme R subunit